MEPRRISNRESIEDDAEAYKSGVVTTATAVVNFTNFLQIANFPPTSAAIQIIEKLVPSLNGLLDMATECTSLFEELLELEDGWLGDAGIWIDEKGDFHFSGCDHAVPNGLGSPGANGPMSIDRLLGSGGDSRRN